MTRYRLPEALGGGQCTYHDTYPQNRESLYCRVTVGEGDEAFTIDLLRSLLTEVEPPLPPEPPVGSVVLDSHGGGPYAWQRHYDKWWCTDDRPDQTWDELNTTWGPLTLLAPLTMLPLSLPEVTP